MGKIHEEEGSASGSQSTTQSSETLDTLNVNTAKEVAKYMPLKDIASLASTSRQHYSFFQPILDNAAEAAVHPLLKAVVEANPEALSQLVIQNPKLLFKKGKIKDSAGQQFYDVSAYQLMIFLGDAQMKREIMALVSPMTEAMEKSRQAQYEQIACGGADLVKMTQDPTQVPFHKVLHQTETYRICNNLLQATFPLLENPDGLIYYKELTEIGRLHVYYASRKTRMVKEVYPAFHSPEEQEAFDALAASMDDMENNSSRRSSNEEHRLIAKTLYHSETENPIDLHRRGIQYDDCDGVRYCDSRFDFNRYYNTNRKCVRLYTDEKWDEGDRAWIELGRRQRELLWRLQFLCQDYLVFYPIPNFNEISNRREFNICYPVTDKLGLVFDHGQLLSDLGSVFSVYKSGIEWCGVCWEGVGDDTDGLGHKVVTVDLVAVCRLVEGEKEAVAELMQEQDSKPSFAGSNR